MRAEKGIILSTDSWDPVFDISNTLADRYGVSISVESPRWVFPANTEDVADVDPQFSAEHHNIHYRVMKHHAVQIRFALSSDGRPNDLRRLLLELADAANIAMPYAYRLDMVGKTYVLVPTRTRNSDGALEYVQPLLDYHVNIPAASRSIAAHAHLLAEQLSEKAGLHISCCESFVAGIPWGLAEVPFGAGDEPAREVLSKLIDLEGQQNSMGTNRHPVYDHWTVRCDGTGSPWCSIEVRGVSSSACR